MFVAKNKANYSFYPMNEWKKSSLKAIIVAFIVLLRFSCIQMNLLAVAVTAESARDAHLLLHLGSLMEPTERLNSQKFLFDKMLQNSAKPVLQTYCCSNDKRYWLFLLVN